MRIAVVFYRVLCFSGLVFAGGLEGKATETVSSGCALDPN